MRGKRASATAVAATFAAHEAEARAATAVNEAQKAWKLNRELGEHIKMLGASLAQAIDVLDETVRRAVEAERAEGAKEREHARMMIKRLATHVDLDIEVDPTVQNADDLALLCLCVPEYKERYLTTRDHRRNLSKVDHMHGLWTELDPKGASVISTNGLAKRYAREIDFGPREGPISDTIKQVIRDGQARLRALSKEHT